MRETLIELAHILIDRFNDGELRTLCFHAGVDYDSLPGEGKANKARELVAYCQRRQSIPELVRIGQQLRPDISWNLPPQPNGDTGVEPFASMPPPRPGEAGARSSGSLRNVLRFSKSAWGILAGASLLFPLAAALLNIIPLANAGAVKLHHIQPTAVLVVASIATLFMVFQVISSRYRLRAEKRRVVQRRAQTAFIVGASALLLYLLVYFVVFDLVDGLYSLDWQIHSLIFLLNDFAMLVLYTAIFAGITRAFMLLGMAEYLGLRD